MLLGIICLFFPAFIAVSVLNALQKRERQFSSFLAAYGSFVSVINLVMLLILVTIFHDKFDVFNETYFTLVFSLKYLILSVFISVISPFIFEYLRQNISLRFSVKLRSAESEKAE